MDMSEEGYSTGSRDGCVRLWDTTFTPVVRINLAESNVGYRGMFSNFS